MSRPAITSRPRVAGRLLTLGLLGLALTGCAAQPADDKRGRAAQTRIEQPAGLVPERVVLGTEPPEDRDRNGYVDTLRVVVYVFGDPNRFPLPMVVDGTFQFRLRSEQGKSLGVWAFAPREVSKAVFLTQPGPAYGFELDLNAVGTDRLPAQAAGLTCEITTADGSRRVGTTETLEVRIGGRTP